VKQSLGRSFRFVELANDINDHMPEYVVHRLIEALNTRTRAVKDSRVLLLGMAYKRNTGDARETPGTHVARRLLSLGANVRVADPYVMDEQLDMSLLRVGLTEDEVRSADALVLLTDHDVFDYEMVGRCARYVLDTRRRMAGPQVEYL
jgi:UDP-N-acetyl-D-glucosamine dehydrogenase